ncbi:hypothetical protein JH06_4264 [Blastocystis sp. subtype 4]|uniref:hypothetical protein n=1 Tax=Blastocystis sp. subtype 4 TaxID=944170 RepID=UPI00071163CB|nr:hypothetical protein JH06_4264 [Blastocystis sp. subtype 4]KNB42157.1 hypothetical protein JH06_4264 [Blastocystis sp. subtype 4]|eukprot:XP_014525600.1 hypothetical protein JH06_4264 [Blastocystis sp. subtype 4]
MCERNCQHCYMRRSNKDAKRFMCFPTHVYDNMEWLYNKGVGTIVISSGEFNNEGRTEFIETIIENTIQKSIEIDRGYRVKNGDYSGGAPIQIGLQMGEIPMNTCRRYYKKGAKTVYLRMEAADRLLYKDVFIRERGYDERIENINKMMHEGFEVYSGTMIGLPFQTDENLVEDILLMKELHVDGLDYGVYIPTKNTPIYSFWRDQNHNDYPKYLDHCYDRLRRVIALSRIVMRNVNITTSEHHMLMQPEAVSDLLNSGANVIKMFSGPLWTRQFNLYFDEMPPAFPEDDVFNHTLGYIQKAGKEVSQNELMLYIAHVRSNHFSFTCLSKKVSSIR